MQSVAPTGTQTSNRGFEPFLSQVSTKIPSVLTEQGKVGYEEQVKDFKPIVQKRIENRRVKEQQPQVLNSMSEQLKNNAVKVQLQINNFNL